MSNRKKRLNLLKFYSNLIERLPFVTMDEGEPLIVKNQYICPLCLNAFDLNKTENELETILTLEDVPPKSLGGKPILITCKCCNNSCGHKLDVFLLNEFQFNEESFSRIKKAKLSYNGQEVNADFRVMEAEVRIDINRKNKQQSITDFCNTLSNEKGETKVNAQVQYYEYKRNPQAAKIAILKSAYLFAFSKLGYQYILHTNLEKVRKQILEPEKSILPMECVVWKTPDKSIEDNLYKVSVNDCIALVVVMSFKLKDSDKKYSFMTILPAPEDKECSIYEHIQKAGGIRLESIRS